MIYALTSIGHCTGMWRCRCEYVDSLHLVGRGSYTDPSNNRSEDFSFKLPTPSTTNEWLLRLYPDVAYANNTENCLPDCLPATWRIDVARAILDKTENNLTMVPGFWQLHAKGLPSGMGGGDCTHKTLDALMMINEQLCRSMIAMDTSHRQHST